MPKLKPLFDEWEDRWWPQLMASAERAEVAPFVPGPPRSNRPSMWHEQRLTIGATPHV
jgi:hypothetical protein